MFVGRGVSVLGVLGFEMTKRKTNVECTHPIDFVKSVHVELSHKTRKLCFVGFLVFWFLVFNFDRDHDHKS